MSKFVASESKEGHEGRKTGGKRGSGDEGDEKREEILAVPPAESLPISTIVSTATATTDQFMHTPEFRWYFVEYVPDDIAPATDQFMFTPEFRRHFVEFVPGDTLMKLRLATKGWKATAEAFIDEGVRSGAMIVHGGKDISWGGNDPRWDMRKLATQVIFLLNITKVGEFACYCAVNLVVVNIPEGIESISIAAFRSCQSLTTVSFPKTLRSIGGWAFGDCSSLENVDLLHTNLQELGNYAFNECPELKSMTIPDSLQTIHRFSRTFHDCFKLVPSNMDIYDSDGVITYLRSKQNQF